MEMMNKLDTQLVFSYVISFITYLTGGFDKMFIALLTIMTIDYITGLMKAIKKKKLSSKIGLNGIAKKVVTLSIIMVANIIDSNISANGVIRDCIIMYYICNEGISILENASYFKVVFPKKLMNILEEVKEESEILNDKRD